MITEAFLDSCFLILLNKHCKIKRNMSLYRDISDILQFVEKQNSVELSNITKNKIDCLKALLTLLFEENSVATAIENITFGEKFKQYKDFLEKMQNIILIDETFSEALKQIRLRKKMTLFFQDYGKISKFMENVKAGNFDSIDKWSEDYESVIRELYSNLMNANRSLSIEATASLDMLSDNYDYVISMIRKKYENVNTTSSGFEVLDKKIFVEGGFEPSRLYCFAGGSGSGKSTVLTNLIYKSALDEQRKSTNKRVYLYVTLENTVEEALMRMYQGVFGLTKREMLDQIGKNVDISSRIKEKLEENNSTIIMKYFPPMSISPYDLMTVLDEAREEYGKDSISGLYLDYLDLLKLDTKYDAYRLELAHITIALKSLAVQYNIPVITASQLGRESYKVQDAQSLNVSMISESIKKIENSDFIMLMALDPQRKNIINVKIGKYRSGLSNLSMEFHVDFSKYQVLNLVLLRKNEDEIQAIKANKVYGAKMIV